MTLKATYSRCVANYWLRLGDFRRSRSYSQPATADRMSTSSCREGDDLYNSEAITHLKRLKRGPLGVTTPICEKVSGGGLPRTFAIVEPD